MSGWYQQYLDDLDLKKISALLQDVGINDPSAFEWLCENAALCRLSFATLILSSDKRQSFSVPQTSIISQTQFGMTKGRPKTARWAFWLCYILKRGLLIKDKPPTSDFLSKLIGILLSRDIPSVEVRTVLGKVKKEAVEHAQQVAQEILKNALLQELSEKAFRHQMKTDLEEGLSPDTVLPGIENGKVSEAWLENVVKVRGSILKRIKKHGPLAGSEPLVSVRGSTMLIADLPTGGSLVGHSPEQKGEIHLSKSQTIAIPHPLLEQIGDVTLNQVKLAEGGGTTSLKFPGHALEINQPYSAAIVALPAWWREWLYVQIS